MPRTPCTKRANVTISNIVACLLVQFDCESGVCGSSLSVRAPERTMTVANGVPHEWKSREIRAHRRKVSCLSWSCDGKSLASGSQDGSIKLWKAEDCNNVRLSSEVSTSGECLSRMAFHPSSPDTMVSVSEHEHSVRFWDLRSGSTSVSLETPGVNSTLSWSGDAQYLVVTSTDYRCSILDTRRMRVLAQLSARSQASDAVFAKGDAQILQTTLDGTLEVAAAADGRLLRSRRGHMSAALAMAEERSERALVASGGDDALVCVWEPEDLICVRASVRASAPIVALAFGGRGGRYLAVASAEGGLDVEGARSGELLGRQELGTPPKMLVWSPAHATLAFPGDLARDSMGVEYGGLELRTLVNG